jgi:rhodanese-related sulfurtransferase
MPKRIIRSTLKKVVAGGAIGLMSVATFAQQSVDPTHASNHTQKTQPTSRAKKLTRSEFDALIAHPDQVLLIDVRRPDEISSIGGFPVYLSIQIKDLKNHLGEIPKDKLIITVSNHAARAGVAADLLADNGFRVAGAVGAQTYQTEGGTLVKVAIPNTPTEQDGSTQAVASTGGK